MLCQGSVRIDLQPNRLKSVPLRHTRLRMVRGAEVILPAQAFIGGQPSNVSDVEQRSSPSLRPPKRGFSRNRGS